MVDMGFRKVIKYLTETYTSGKTAVSIGKVSGVTTLYVSSAEPRQYIEVPWKLVEKAEEDLWQQEAADAVGRRKDQNG